MEPGSRLGRFIIRERLGRGAVATVYLADDTLIGTTVALKALHADRDVSGDDPGERLKREIALARRITHPGVCQVFDLHEEQGVLFLSMEYVKGRSLESVLEAEGRLAGERTARIIGAVCRALKAAHDAGILHRDLKPGNIMLRDNDEPSMLDFGYAIGPDVGRLTATGVWVGTLQYLAPEILKNEPATRSTDIYTLGVTLYRCLTGQFPFQGLTYGEIASGVLYREPTAPSQYVPEIGPQLEAVVLKAMHREASERFDDAGELEAALEEVASELREVTDPGSRTPVPGPYEADSGDELDPMLDDGTTQREIAHATVLVCESVGGGPTAELLAVDALRPQPLTDSSAFRSELNKWGGTPVATDGNGFAAWFHSPDAALRAALGMQRAIERRTAAADQRAEPMHLRIGIRTGFAKLGGRHISAGAVDSARAVAMAARGDEIMVDGETRTSLNDKLRALTTPAEDRAVESTGLLALYHVDWSERVSTSVRLNPLADAVEVEKRRVPIARKQPPPMEDDSGPTDTSVDVVPVPEPESAAPSPAATTPAQAPTKSVGRQSVHAQMVGLAVPGGGVASPRPSAGSQVGRVVRGGRKDGAGRRKAKAQSSPVPAVRDPSPSPAGPVDKGSAEWKAPPDVSVLRDQHADLALKLEHARTDRGIVAGDNWTLDSLQKTAELELSRGRWVDAVEYLRLALSEVDGIVIGESFVAAKIQRFHTAMRDRGALREMKRFQPILGEVMRAYDGGDFAAANGALNRGFEMLFAPTIR